MLKYNLLMFVLITTNTTFVFAQEGFTKIDDAAIRAAVAGARDEALSTIEVMVPDKAFLKAEKELAAKVAEAEGKKVASTRRWEEDLKSIKRRHSASTYFGYPPEKADIRDRTDRWEAERKSIDAEIRDLQAKHNQRTGGLSAVDVATKKTVDVKGHRPAALARYLATLKSKGGLIKLIPVAATAVLATATGGLGSTGSEDGTVKEDIKAIDVEISQ
jgi:hypothetical protein